jgi:hypothetical protein
MREAEEVKRLRFPFSAPLPVSDRERSELNKPRFVGMQFQAELPKPLGEFRQKLWHPFRSGIQPRCRPRTARRSHRRAPAFDAMPDPQIEDVMEIDIRQQRRCTAALRRPFLHRIRFPSSSTPAFSHFWMSRTTRRSAMRCSMNFTSHSCEIASKKPRMSRSSTQFTFFVSSPV